MCCILSVTESLKFRVDVRRVRIPPSDGALK
jgi:hypothetical protein